jgi:hypothetical protein
MNLDTIKRTNGLLDHAEDMLAGEREGVSAIYDKAVHDGISKGGLKFARRLARMKPGKRADFLATFDIAREAMALDAQLDIATAIRKAA